MTTVPVPVPPGGARERGTRERGTQERAGRERSERERGAGADFPGFLSLEQLDRDLFRGWCHDGIPSRAFGGQVAAQALTAAGRTVPGDRAVHSLHGYFLRAGDSSRPLVYTVERIRDGASYTSRRVSALQGGEIVFTLSASFKRPERTDDRQQAMPPTPGPDSLPDLYETWARNNPQDFAQAEFRRVLDMRYVPGPPEPNAPGLTEQKLWMRAAQRLPDDPMLHACALAYASDLFLAPSTVLSEQLPRMLREEADEPSSVFLTSLDHGIWYHRPFRADEWMLFAQRSPTAVDGRGLAFADVWSLDGRLIAHVVQETVARPARTRRR
ncbi:acyl-CoA thioesterase [Streptomyces yaizuensis]|uniref:Acyl-CoA thioesterase II n=1 Tax=Streptomyces yaizuensis TaxID=2989713 RepID=A0ABQ5NS99_9ACTN|nr:acyl-CoA thioesterase II [Streptomyces sp. YSPA8]GLF93242.1 acyl-CoA thioesterase II [Streptomyces sp. YSPA8]